MTPISIHFGAFRGTRLRAARRVRKFSALDLGDFSDVDPVTISRLESGATTNPQARTVKALADALDWPPGFFFDNDLYDFLELEPHRATFRSNALAANDRDAALSAGSIALLISDRMERYAKMAPWEWDTPALIEYQDDPVFAAEKLRELWKLGDEPIENMVHLLEDHGVRVFWLAIDTYELDAFSCWHNGIPYVFLNTVKIPERSRFDCAHELGHLCMHDFNDMPARAEAQANAFAASLLAPEDDVHSYADANFWGRDASMSIDQLIEAKCRWGISLQAMVYRFRELRILSGRQARHFFREMKEIAIPDEYKMFQREQSVFWAPNYVDGVWTKFSEGQMKDIADQLMIPVDVLHNLVNE